MNRFVIVAAPIIAAAAALCGTAQAAPNTLVIGGRLVNSNGATLYTYDKDSAGKSACVEGCAKVWPAYTASDDAKDDGDWTVIARDDGKKQWAYKGKPVYTYSKDPKPGDAAGDNFKDVWHAIPK
jgi:predicted lipoprotein with Yx(FWY)xxD motif